jgi:hypothetical protein
LERTGWFNQQEQKSYKYKENITLLQVFRLKRRAPKIIVEEVEEVSPKHPTCGFRVNSAMRIPM